LPTTEIDVPVPPIEDASGRALESFYQRLAQLMRGRAREPVRIVVYGDSNLTEDLFTSELRRWLQPRFGDAGHGYVAMGVPWPWYRHQDVVHGVEPKAWKSFAVSTDPAPDQWYGLGGIAAECRSWGARAWVGTAAKPASVGQTASRADVFFLQQPRGRSFRVEIDGDTVATVSTDAPERATGFRRFELEDTPHRIKFLADGGVRLFGVALERAVPGVVVDSIGVGGSNERILARMNPRSIREALAHRPYDLIVFLTGATEDANAKHDAALRKRIRLHQQTLPNASLLVMSPPDFANGNLKRPRPSGRIVKLGRQKRAVAEELGCAFWDFHAAMGGKLSIARFALRHMAEPDLAHLTEKGHAYMARRFLWALLSDFRSYLKREAPQDCSPPDPVSSG
jgi:hypothetical protein